MREVAVLVLVFGPLDVVLRETQALTWVVVGGIVVVGAVMLVAGVAIERARP